MSLVAIARAPCPRARPGRRAPESADRLVTRIAALDAAHAARELSPEEGERYRRERAALKRALTEQLRRESPRDGL